MMTKVLAVAVLCAALVAGAAAENKFGYHVQDGDFTVSHVDLTTADDAPFGAGVAATVSLSGTVADASKILAGTIQYKVYEDYVQHFTQEGNMPYFKCTNKGCDRNAAVALTLADPDATTKSDFTASLTFTMPKAEKTGAFHVVVWGSNQNHFPYDFSLTLVYNYSSPLSADAAAVVEASSTYAPGKITWAAAGGNMTVDTFEILAPGGQFASSVSAHVNATGNLTKVLTAGATQWQIYEQGVRSFIESGNSNYFRCGNKGCNIMDPVALKLQAPTVPTNYTLSFAFNIPTPEATGQFTLVAWGTDQDHFPYDFSVSAHFTVPMSA